MAYGSAVRLSRPLIGLGKVGSMERRSRTRIVRALSLTLSWRSAELIGPFDRVRALLKERGSGGRTQQGRRREPPDPAQEILAHEDLRVSIGTRTVGQRLAEFCRSMALFNVGAKRWCASTISRTRTELASRAPHIVELAPKRTRARPHGGGAHRRRDRAGAADAGYVGGRRRRPIEK